MDKKKILEQIEKDLIPLRLLENKELENSLKFHIMSNIDLTVNQLVKESDSLPCVTSWLSFDDQKPEVNQEILIVWEKYPPEIRRLDAESLAKDWTGIRWMPIPAWR